MKFSDYKGAADAVNDSNRSEWLQFLVCEPAACGKAHIFAKATVSERNIVPRSHYTCRMLSRWK